jgi:hypothetical protein
MAEKTCDPHVPARLSVASRVRITRRRGFATRSH